MLTRDLVDSLFEYRNGVLYWKVNRGPVKTAGRVAGGRSVRGYQHIRIGKQIHKRHRLVFLLHHGYLPQCVDHINGDVNDDRIENLRASTLSQNMHNQGVRKTNTSGIKGVSWYPRYNKWRACLTVDRKMTTVGYFLTKEEAGEAVREARAKLHGEFANHGNHN